MKTVADIMERDLVSIQPDASIAQLIERLEKSRISGLPVVDDRGGLRGVVSQRDIVRLARDLERVPEAVRWGLGAVLSGERAASVESPVEGEFFAYYVTPAGGFVDVRDQIREFPADVFEGYRVEDVMTLAPLTVDADTSLSELARRLLEARIHRALVLEGEALVGIVTTTDILKAVAQG